MILASGLLVTVLTEKDTVIELEYEMARRRSIVISPFMCCQEHPKKVQDSKQF